MQKIAAALVAFRRVCPTISKDSINPHFKSKFASLDAIHKVVDPLLAENGLMVMQFPASGDGTAGCLTRIVHESGETMEYEFLVPLAKRDPQGACAAVSYARRYGLSGALGLVTEDDDDGNAASGSPAAAVRKTPKKGRDAHLDSVSREKLMFAARERLKELEMPSEKSDAISVCADVMRRHGYASSLEALQTDFPALFSEVQEWEPGKESA